MKLILLKIQGFTEFENLKLFRKNCYKSLIKTKIIKNQRCLHFATLYRNIKRGVLENKESKDIEFHL